MYERYQHYNITFHEDNGPITTLLLQCDLLSVLILHAHKVVLVPALSSEPLVLLPWIVPRPHMLPLACRMRRQHTYLPHLLFKKPVFVSPQNLPFSLEVLFAD